MLPNDVLAEVICRLSVKNLLRLKCVSRSWLALISSPHFVKLHLKQSAQTKINLSLFLSCNNLNRVDFDSLENGGVLRQEVEIDYNPLRHLDQDNNGLTNIWGSCDGLLCISNASYHSVTLWNPSTRKSIQLPYTTIDIPNPDHRHPYCYYGFGYDNTNDDYKVVRLVLFLGDIGRDVADYEVKVYSLRSNSWHTSVKFPDQYPIFVKIGNSIVGGAMHWTSRENDEERSIVAFDFRTDKYRVIPWPETEIDKSSIFLSLGNLEGCLSLTCNCNHYTEIVEVWLLKEYGEGSEFWSKLIRMELFPLQIVRPLAYSKSGRKVLLEMDDWSTLVWYNLEEGFLEEDIMFHEDVIEAESCMESLVSVEVLPQQL